MASRVRRGQPHLHAFTGLELVGQVRLAHRALRFGHAVLGAHQHAILGFSVRRAMPAWSVSVPVIFTMRGGLALFRAG
jgi:hypothetical protein